MFGQPMVSEKLEYPPEAIWETIVNAVIHRDYSISDDIQILIFDNRVEILSPGKLPGYVNIENILSARFSRNPNASVRTLNRYRDAPNKDLGEVEFPGFHGRLTRRAVQAGGVADVQPIESLAYPSNL